MMTVEELSRELAMAYQENDLLRAELERVTKERNEARSTVASFKYVIKRQGQMLRKANGGKLVKVA